MTIDQTSTEGSREDQKSFGRTKSFLDDMWTKTRFKKPNLKQDYFFWKLTHVSDAPNCRLKKSNFSFKSLISQVSISQDAPNSNSIHIAHNNPTGSDIKVEG